MKKTIALLSIFWIMLLNYWSTNANSYNLATWLATNDTITINTQTDTIFDGSTSANISITKDWVSVANFDSVIVNDLTWTNDNIVITKTGAFWDGYYLITYSTDNGVYWSVEIDNNSNFNNVNVSATVLPKLSMSLTTNNLNFGILEENVLNTTNDWTNPTSVWLSLSTNAANWLTVSVSSANAWLKNEHNNLIAYTTNDALTEYYSLKLQNANNITLVWINTYANVLSANTNTIIANTWNTPVNNASFEIQPQAKITNVTAAWNYSDTLTFTVTGSF